MSFADEIHPITVVPFRSSWHDEFLELSDVLRRALVGTSAIAIDHVGSTAVGGLCSKDVIDVQVRVRELDPELETALHLIEFRRRPESWNNEEATLGHVSPKMVFAGPVGARAVNVSPFR